MNAVGPRQPTPQTAPDPVLRAGRRSPISLRLVGLHLASRRLPAALVTLVTGAGIFQLALRWTGDRGGLQVPLIIEAASAAVVSITVHSPFGESEQAMGRFLPYLRFGTAVGLTAAACMALVAGATAAALLGGTLALLRNVAGMAGVGLLFAAGLGSSLSWIGPMAHLAVAEDALSSGWHMPWTWPARPPDDVGAAICALLVFGAGLVVIARRGARDAGRE